MAQTKRDKDVTSRKKVKTKGNVWIPGGLKDTLMGSSKDLAPKKR